MHHVHACRHCVIGVTAERDPVLLEGPPPLYRLLESPLLAEHCQPEGLASMPNSPGLDLAAIECRRVSGVPAGKAGHVDVVARATKRVRIEALAIDRYSRRKGTSGLVGRLLAGVSSALCPRRPTVHQSQRSRRLPGQHPRHLPTVGLNIYGVAACLTPEGIAAAIILMVGGGVCVVLGHLIIGGL